MTSSSNFSAENLRQLRSNAGFSRNHLIEQLGRRGVEMHVNSLRRIEEGEQPMKIQEAIAFADIFGMGLDEFVTRPANRFEAQISITVLTMRRDLAAVAEKIVEFQAGRIDAIELSHSPSFKSQQSAAAAELVDTLSFADGIWPKMEEVYDAIDDFWDQPKAHAQG